MRQVTVVAIVMSAFAGLACDRGRDAPDGPQAEPQPTGVWAELELPLQSMKEFCAVEAAKPENAPRKGFSLDAPDHPTRQIATKEWTGFLRYVPARKGEFSKLASCFINVSVANASAARDAETFEKDLGLPACEERLVYPDAVFCLVAKDDPSGLNMWQARFARDRKLVALGISTQGYAPARGEKLLGAAVVRPKDRPQLPLASNEFGWITSRVEVDELGATYSQGSPWFDELETPAVRARFSGETEECGTGVSRCTFSAEAEGDVSEQTLRRMLKRQTNYIGKQVPPTLEQRKRDDVVALDVAANVPWSDVGWVFTTAQRTMSRVLLLADGPPNGPLPTWGTLEVGEFEMPAPGGKVEEVREEDAATFELTLTNTELEFSRGGVTETIQRTASGHDWDAAHKAVLGAFEEGLVRPKLLVLVNDDVPWLDVFRAVEIVSYRRADAADPSTCVAGDRAVGETVPCQSKRLFDIDVVGNSAKAPLGLPGLGE